MNRKAVMLFSGGLDSILAARLMLEQRIELYALNLLTMFCNCTAKGCMHQATKSAKELGIPLRVLNITEEYMKEVVKNPRYGRGRNMNPCIDCRIFLFRKAKEFMKEISADFVVTGEVLGERPMSQTKNAMELIERESGLDGLVVRPLSAKNFKESIAEKQGIVDRNTLLNIQGRSRVRQIGLTKEFGIIHYPCPAGGCLLTDKNFSRRLKDLLLYIPDYETCDLYLLKIGRQFRISQKAKLFVGREERENKLLADYSKDGDYIFECMDIPGPVGLVRGALNNNDVNLVCSIIVRYSDAREIASKVLYKKLPRDEEKTLIVKPVDEDIVSRYRI